MLNFSVTITEIPPNQTIRYNDYSIAGYEVVEPKHTIVIDGKEVSLSEASFQELKRQLTE